MTIDNTLARVGSSNLNNRSMGVDTECDLAVEGTGKEYIQKAIALFRSRLLAEHLGVSPETVLEKTAEQRSLIGAVEKLRNSDRTLVPLEPGESVTSDGTLLEVNAFDPDEPIDVRKLMKEYVTDQPEEAGRRSIWHFIIVLVIMIGLAAVWRWTPLAGLVSQERLSSLVEHIRGTPTAPLIVVGVYVFGSLFLIPVTLMIVGTALTFGPLAGPIYSLIGCLLSAMMTYALGRALGRGAVARLTGSWADRLSRRLAKHGVITVTGLRLLPIAPYTIVNMVAGAGHIRFWHFVLGTAFGMAPGITAITLLKVQMGAVISERQITDFLILALVVALVVAGAVLIRQKFAKRNNTRAEDRHANEKGTLDG